MNIVVPYQERLPLRKAHDVYVVRTCHALAGLGHRVHLLVGRGGLPLPELLRYYGLPPTEGLMLTPLPLLRSRLSWSLPFHLAAGWTLRRLAASVGIDIVLASTLKLARTLRRGASGMCLVYDLHELAALPGLGSSDRQLGLEAQVLGQADAIVTTTHALEAEIRRAYPGAGPIRVVPLATQRAFPEAPAPYPSEVPAEPEAFYVGQLYALQGLPVALEALARCSGPRLNVVGGGDRRQMRELGRRLEVEDRVTFHGFRPPADLPALMASAHWFVLPSLASGRMPYVSHMKCYDYLGYRRPILASNLASVRELLTDGETALLPAPGDSRAWADAMERLLKDPHLARRVGDQAWELGLRHSPEHRAAMLGEFFERVRAGGPRA